MRKSDGLRVDGECGTSVEAGQVFYAWKHSDCAGYNEVEIKMFGKRSVHNLLIFQRSYGRYDGGEKTLIYRLNHFVG